MKTRAALIFEQPGKWQVTEVDQDGPGEGEVLVRLAAAGLCHSDDNLSSGRLKARHLPRCGGHEGAGVVEAVGPGATRLAPGDHVVTSFIPVCGTCRYCRAGAENLCDLWSASSSVAKLDGSFRKHLDGVDIAETSFVGTFSELSAMPESCCIKIPKHLSLRSAALIGCGVPTGWGSAVNGAQVGPGHVVVVMGAGGVGINAVQGARHAGAEAVIAVDPVPFKQDTARSIGATHAVGSIDEASELARELSGGRGAHSVIVTVGALTPEDIAAGFEAIGKGGVLVIASSSHAVGLPVGLHELTMKQKRVQGVLFGMMSPHRDVPRLLELYEAGALKLDELVTRTYSLDDINVGFDDMHAGATIRGVVEFAS